MTIKSFNELSFILSFWAVIKTYSSILYLSWILQFVCSCNLPYSEEGPVFER